MRFRRTGMVVAGLAAGAVILSGCTGDGDGGETGGDEKVTITVAGLPPTENADQRELYLERVEAFEAEYPDITLEPSEAMYDPSTFNAMLEGGTLPHVLGVPFTEIQALIGRGQVTDISAAAEKSDVIMGLNQNVLDVARADGKLFAVPIASYTMGLLYNRALFTEAGLDPDNPPTTWDEVAEAAKAISNKTDADGFGLMSTENAGGWTLSTLSYAFGGLMQDEVDGETAAVFADTGATAQALEWVHDVRWNDGSWTANTLLSGEDARNAFAGGNLGMWIGGADIYEDVVGNRGMNPDDVGIAPIPLDSDGLGALGGGSAEIVSPAADEAQIDAALKWIEFADLSKFLDQDVVEADAEKRTNDDWPVGAPRLPIIGPDQEADYQSWIEPWVNVPQEHFVAYMASTTDMPIVTEPAVEAQALYASLDAVLQTVLSDENADIDALLQTAQEQFTAQYLG